MKITNRGNGMAKLLFMQHERDIFRVREWVIFRTCQRTLNMTQLQSTKLRPSSLPVISHAGYYCWAPVLQRLMVGTPRSPAPLSTQPRIKCISHIHRSTHHTSNRYTTCYAQKHGWKCSLNNQSSKLFLNKIILKNISWNGNLRNSVSFASLLSYVRSWRSRSTSLLLNFPNLEVAGSANSAPTCVPMLQCTWCALGLWIGGHAEWAREKSIPGGASSKVIRREPLRKNEEAREAGMSEGQNKSLDQKHKLKPNHAGPWKLLFISFCPKQKGKFGWIVSRESAWSDSVCKDPCDFWSENRLRGSKVEIGRPVRNQW